MFWITTSPVKISHRSKTTRWSMPAPFDVRWRFSGWEFNLNRWLFSVSIWTQRKEAILWALLFNIKNEANNWRSIFLEVFSISAIRPMLVTMRATSKWFSILFIFGKIFRRISIFWSMKIRFGQTKRQPDVFHLKIQRKIVSTSIRTNVNVVKFAPIRKIQWKRKSARHVLV